MTIILAILLLVTIYLFSLAIHDAIENEKKFQKVLQDFKESKTVDEFYQRIKKFL